MNRFRLCESFPAKRIVFDRADCAIKREAGLKISFGVGLICPEVSFSPEVSFCPEVWSVPVSVLLDFYLGSEGFNRTVAVCKYCLEDVCPRGKYDAFGLLLLTVHVPFGGGGNGIA